MDLAKYFENSDFEIKGIDKMLELMLGFVFLFIILVALANHFSDFFANIVDFFVGESISWNKVQKKTGLVCGDFGGKLKSREPCQKGYIGKCPRHQKQSSPWKLHIILWKSFRLFFGKNN